MNDVDTPRHNILLCLNEDKEIEISCSIQIVHSQLDIFHIFLNVIMIDTAGVVCDGDE